MWVFIIFALIPSGDPRQPIEPLTRGVVQYYLTEDGCKAGAKIEVKKWLEKMPVEPLMLASKCVRVDGPIGEDI